MNWKKYAAVVVGAHLGAVSAYAVDYSAAASAASTEVDSAISAALPIGIVVMASLIGWRLFKRFARG